MAKLIVKNKSYTNENCIHNLINYITNDKETSRILRVESFGVNPLNNETMISSMMRSKERVNRINGKQAYHLIISIYRTKNPMSDDQKIIYGKNIIYDIGNYFLNHNIQSVIALQSEKEYNWHNIHVHCVINSIDMKTGLKITNTSLLFNKILSLLLKEYPYLKMEQYVTYD